MKLTATDIVRMMPGCQLKTAQLYVGAINDTMQAYGIDTPLRVAHFIAQIGHESLSLQFMEEIASGVAYEGRKDLGNVYSGDGKRFKGRGAIQNTGRANYREYTEYLATKGSTIDFCATPDILSQLPYCIDVAGWFWSVKHNLNKLADADDLKAVTKKINGGLTGYDDRKNRLAKCKLMVNSKV